MDTLQIIISIYVTGAFISNISVFNCMCDDPNHKADAWGKSIIWMFTVPYLFYSLKVYGYSPVNRKCPKCGLKKMNYTGSRYGKKSGNEIRRLICKRCDFRIESILN